MEKSEFKVSEENKQRLQENYGVDLDKLDDETRNSLLGLYDPGKSCMTAKICDYLAIFSFLIGFIALLRLHWFILVPAVITGFLFLIVGFLAQRNVTKKNLKKPKDMHDLLEKARNVALVEGYASSALFQRKIKIPYAIAARLVELLEEEGLVGPPDGAKPRPVLIKKGSK